MLFRVRRCVFGRRLLDDVDPEVATCVNLALLNSVEVTLHVLRVLDRSRPVRAELVKAPGVHVGHAPELVAERLRLVVAGKPPQLSQELVLAVNVEGLGEVDLLAVGGQLRRLDLHEEVKQCLLVVSLFLPQSLLALRLTAALARTLQK